MNEFYTTKLKALPYYYERRATRLMSTGLELAHSHDADPSPFREFLLAPIKKAASGSALCR